jgi:hypothetical protein
MSKTISLRAAIIIFTIIFLSLSFHYTHHNPLILTPLTDIRIIYISRHEGTDFNFGWIMKSLGLDYTHKDGCFHMQIE